MLPRTLVPYELNSIHKTFKKKKKTVYIREVLKFPLHLNQTERKDMNSIHLTQVTIQREGPTETI